MMSDTKPRDLTDAELELIKAPPGRTAESVPLSVPPGTQVAVQDIDPRPPISSGSATPTAGPPDLSGAGGAGAP